LKDKSIEAAMLHQTYFLISLVTASATIKRGTPFYNASQLVEAQILGSPYPYEFPVLENGPLADSGQFPMPACHNFTLEEATIDQLQEALSKGTLTSVKLAQCYLQRIYQTDSYIRYVNRVWRLSKF
jgi:amidase